MTATISDSLAKLIIEDADFDELERSLSTYCPFEATGMVNAEIRHSAFLAHALDPYRPHEFGSDFLRLLLDTILKVLEAPPVSRLELHISDFDDVDVRREWRRIDILVVLPAEKLVIAFELKLGADEGQNQLPRYSQILEETWPTQEGWRHLKLFLTRNSDPPSDDTWYPIDYSLIVEAINNFEKANKSGSELARKTLISYAKMLQRHHMGDRNLDKIAETLWKKHAEALNFLLDHRPDADGGLGQMLFDRQADLAKAASTDTLTLVPERASKRWFNFRIEQWSDIPDFTHSQWTTSGHFIQVQLEVDPVFVKLFIALGPGPEPYRSSFYELCRDLMPRKGAKGAGWKTIRSKTILGRTTMENANEPEDLYEQIKISLSDWIKNDVALVDTHLRANIIKNISSRMNEKMPTQHVPPES